jgi:hypothetical protein
MLSRFLANSVVPDYPLPFILLPESIEARDLLHPQITATNTLLSVR